MKLRRDRWFGIGRNEDALRLFYCHAGFCQCGHAIEDALLRLTHPVHQAHAKGELVTRTSAVLDAHGDGRGAKTAYEGVLADDSHRGKRDSAGGVARLVVCDQEVLAD